MKHDFSKGFEGCASVDLPLADGDVLREIHGVCACPYMLLNEDCTPKSGILIGTGIDLSKKDQESFWDSYVSKDLQLKIQPFLGDKIKENPIQYLQENILELTIDEIYEIDEFIMS